MIAEFAQFPAQPQLCAADLPQIFTANFSAFNQRNGSFRPRIRCRLIVWTRPAIIRRQRNEGSLRIGTEKAFDKVQQIKNKHQENDRSTSATKYKEAIAYDVTLDYAKRLLNVKPASWHDKAEDERLAAIAEGRYDGQYSAYAQKYIGAIAEDMADANLNEFITYGVSDEFGNREIEGIEYARLPVLFIPLVNDLYQQIEILKAQLAIDEGKITQLEAA